MTIPGDGDRERPAAAGRVGGAEELPLPPREPADPAQQVLVLHVHRGVPRQVPDGALQLHSPLHAQHA